MILLLWGCRPEPEPTGDDDDDADNPAIVGETPSTPRCHGVERVGIENGPVAPSVRLTATLAEPGGAFAICDDGAGDRVLAESEGGGTEVSLAVMGLRAERSYTCTAYASCGGPSRGLVYAPRRPEGVPRFEVEGEPESGVWTVFNTQNGCFGGGVASAVAVDPEGAVRWAYPVGRNLVCDLDVTALPGGRVHVGGGWGIFDSDQPNRGVFRTVDLEGNVVVEREEPDFGLGFNHHSQPLPDGSYLSATGTVNSAGDFDFYGVGLEQWHPDRGLVYTFDSQSLLDAGDLPPPDDPYEIRPYHANSARLVEDRLGAGLWVSLYGARQIWRVDRTSGRLHSVFGAGGDYALVDTRGDPLPDDQFPWVQHDPEYSEPQGTEPVHVLVYDNGQGRPGRDNYSRVAEFALDPDALVATLLWDWTEPGWFNPIVGDADWLPGGHVLVTRGFSEDWTPESSDTSQILELEPPAGTSPGRVAWRLRWPDGGWITFRGQRLDGCDLFRNAKYCPEVADRIDALLADR